MKLWRENFVALLVLALLVACGDDESSGGAEPVAEARNVSGYVQKGPFLKGSEVVVQELDEMTLLPTGKSFDGSTENDAGAYSIDIAELESPFVLIRADGNYRNELTGKNSESQITLYALVNLADRDEANINILTHLSYKRALYLATNDAMDMDAAKRKAVQNVLLPFKIACDCPYAERLDVSGNSGGDAALLALSVLFLGNIDKGGLSLESSVKSGSGISDESKLENRMKSFAEDIERDGVWNDSNALAKMADWASIQSLDGKLGSLRKSVKMYIDNFWWGAYGLGTCDEKRDGEELRNVNALSSQHGLAFVCRDSSWRLEEYPDVDSGDVDNDTLRLADDVPDIEKDTYGLECKEFGRFAKGVINKDNTYFCYGTQWKRVYGKTTADYGKLVDERDGQIYRTVTIGKQTWMAENINYDVGPYFVAGDTNDTYGGYYRWDDIERVCPEGWHVPTKGEWDYLYAYMDSNATSMQAFAKNLWRFPYDAYGFSAVPAGMIIEDGESAREYTYASFWASSFEAENTKKRPYSWTLESDTAYWTLGLENDVRMSVRCIEDSVWLYGECTEANRDSMVQLDRDTYYVCGKDGWYPMTPSEYEAFTWTIGHEADARWRKGGVTNQCYVFEEGAWREADAFDCILGIGGCTKSREGEIVYTRDTTAYICKNRYWKGATHTEKDTYQWSLDYEQGAVRNAADGDVYVFENGAWRLGTELDSILVKLGGTACINEGDTSTVKYNGFYYVCSEYFGSWYPHVWEPAPTVYSDTYEDRAECSETGKYGDGRLHDIAGYDFRTYVCDEGEFRQANYKELSLKWGCSSYVRGKKLNVDGAHYVCSDTGWVADLGVFELDSFVDQRDGREYKTVVIGTQTWMAENLNYKDSVKTPGLEGNRWCYDDEAEQCDTYGSIYSCEISNQVCPAGWRLPTLNEWYDLFNFVARMGGDRTNSLRAEDGWASSNGHAAPGTDDFGFAALAGGLRYDEDSYGNLTREAWFWYDNECIGTGREGIVMTPSTDALGTTFFWETVAFYVRCIKDDE